MNDINKIKTIVNTKQISCRMKGKRTRSTNALYATHTYTLLIIKRYSIIFVFFFIRRKKNVAYLLCANSTMKHHGETIPCQWTKEKCIICFVRLLLTISIHLSIIYFTVKIHFVHRRNDYKLYNERNTKWSMRERHGWCGDPNTRYRDRRNSRLNRDNLLDQLSSLVFSSASYTPNAQTTHSLNDKK